MNSGPQRVAKTPGRHLVLVVGVPGSGVGLLSGVLRRVGFRVPQPEVPTGSAGQAGSGEPTWAAEFHERLLERGRVRLFDARPSAWAQVHDVSEEDSVLHELRAWLAVQFVGAEHVVVTDPRLAWFLPLWVRCARDRGISTSVVTLLHHPADTISRARELYDGAGSDDASRAAAWLNAMLESEHLTRALPRVFVRYDDLLQDWAQEVTRVGDASGLEWLTQVDLSRFPEVAALTSAGPRRSNADWSRVSVPVAVQSMADEVWKELSGLADPGGDTEERRAALDEARSRYDRLYGEAEAIAQSSVAAAASSKRPAARPGTMGKSSRTAQPPAGSRGPAAAQVSRLMSKVPARYRRRVSPRWRRRLRVLASKVGLARSR